MEVFDIFVDILTQFVDNLLERELILPLIFVCISIGIFIFVVKFFINIISFPDHPPRCFGVPRSGSSRQRSESSQKVIFNGKEI